MEINIQNTYKSLDSYIKANERIYRRRLIWEAEDDDGTWLEMSFESGLELEETYQWHMKNGDDK